MHPSVPATALLSALLCALQATDLQADDASTVEGYELQIQHTSERLQQLDAEIASSRVLKEKLQRAVADAEQHIGERRTRIDELQQTIENYNGKLAELEARVADELATVANHKQLLAESLRNTHRISTGTGLKAVLRHNDPVLADRLAVYTDYFMRAQRLAIDEQLTILRRIEAAHDNALKDRNWLNYIKKKALNQHGELTAERTARRQSINRVDSSLSKKTRSVAQLKADQQRLQTLMEELKALEAAQSGYFAAGKGDYALPVNGAIDAHFGEVKSVGKLKWEGIFVRATAGGPVRTIADGEIVYSDWLQGFGMLVIIDHGDGFMTLYGGNRDVTLSKGTYVESGATIATVGDSGGQRATGVYFEIRQNATPVDPEGWVRVDSTVRSANK